MTRTRLVVLVSLAMLAFAGNSLLCRMALKHTRIDAASFTTVRLVSGALMLWLLARLQPGAGATTTDRKPGNEGNWLSALALFVYAAGFSFAYVSMTAATGALILFGAVQATIQLSVPVIAALGGVAFIGETITVPMLMASGAILGGIALVILDSK